MCRSSRSRRRSPGTSTTPPASPAGSRRATRTHFRPPTATPTWARCCCTCSRSDPQPPNLRGPRPPPPPGSPGQAAAPCGRGGGGDDSAAPGGDAGPGGRPPRPPEGAEETVRFALRRFGFFLLTLWAAVTLNFMLPRMMPGNPALSMMAKFHGRLTGQALAALEVIFGVDTHQGLVSQYFHYLGDMVTGRFGTSLFFFPQPVSQVIRTAIPWTLGLVGITTILAFLLGTAIGIAGAWRRGGRLDSLLPPVFVITSAIPFFWIGMMLILLFAVRLRWLPTAFAYDPTVTPGISWPFVSNVLVHALLPALTLLITTIGIWILTMRNNMITTLAEDYVRMARAKGLSSRRIMYDYAARNAILPNLTGFAMSLGFVLGGAILVEYVFSYPGVGYMLLQAVENEDYPLMQALFLLITVAVLVAILLADIATALLDPRTRSAG